MKLIKMRFKILLLTNILTMTMLNPKTQAGELEDEMAKATAKAYAHHQIKVRVAEGLNKTPEILLSKDPSLGTMMLIQYNAAMAIFELSAAKTDKSKFLATLKLVSTAAPAFATAVIVAQILDEYLTMTSTLQIQRLQAETAALTSRANWNLNQIENAHNLVLRDLFKASYLLNKDIEGISKELTAAPISKYFMTGEGNVPSLSEFITGLQSTQSLVTKTELLLSTNLQLIDRIKEFQAEDQLHISMAQLENENSVLLSSMTLYKAYKEQFERQYFNAATRLQLAGLATKDEGKTETASAYIHCIKEINTAKSRERSFHSVTRNQHLATFKECITPFPFLEELL